MWRGLRSERGASVVEFALIVPLLVLLAIGIAEFGRAFQVQGTLTAAAREGVRVMALQNDPAATRSTIRTAAASLNPAVTDQQIAISPTSCPTTYTQGATVTVTITYQHPFLSGFFGAGVTMTGTGVMRCSG
jgi:Flp pilus assembly protein TadG